MKSVSRVERGIFTAMLIILFVPAEMRVEASGPESAPMPPPPPKHEVVPVRPMQEAVWVAGHWRWEASRRSFIWHEGKWLPAPRGWVWLPHRWKSTPTGWAFVEGMWKKAP
jgi:hypothetical protein